MSEFDRTLQQTLDEDIHTVVFLNSARQYVDEGDFYHDYDVTCYARSIGATIIQTQVGCQIYEFDDRGGLIEWRWASQV